MLTKKSTYILIVSSVLFSFAALTACNDSSKTNTSDTTTVQAAPADTSMQMMQDSSMTDTSTMDTASTRPIRHPN
jgi:hypothetical protein